MSKSKLHLSDALWQQAAAEAEGTTEDWVDRKIADIRSILFDAQLAFIDDPDRFKSVLCNRRAGKTTAFAAFILTMCLSRRDSLVAYVTMTRGVAKKNVWWILRKLCDAYELNVKWNNTDLSGLLPNGSRFFLCGADNIGEVDKLRGAPLDAVIIDEAKSFPVFLFEELVDEVLIPTLADRMGHLVLGGTPGRILKGPFYLATCGKSQVVVTDEVDGRRHAACRPYDERAAEKWQGVAYEWSFHRWASKDNAAMPHIWGEQLQTKIRKGWTDEDPVWRREYLGEWVADDNGMVYRYDEDRNGWTPDKLSSNLAGLPEDHEWRYVMGVDLGYNDDFALEVGAYSETHPHFFHVYGFNAPGMNIQQIAGKIREVEAKFGGFDMMVGDAAGLGKTIFAELAEVHGLAIEAAKKRDKRDHIEILNSNLLSGMVKILKDSNLAFQMTYLQWDADRKNEDPNFPNHDTDAFLYLIRHSLHHMARPRVVGPERDSPEWWTARDKAELEELEAAERRGPGEWMDGLKEIDIIGEAELWGLIH